MAKNKLGDRINDLFAKGDWDGSRELLEKERTKSPDNHWVLTQLAVTHYEQRRYEDALPLLLSSLEIVPDCPLTLWNLAGTLDSLGKFADAIQVYIWLLESQRSVEDDPCWESKEWTESLKADCMYRLGDCFRHLGIKKTADHWYREYINALLTGIEGLYPIEDAMRQIRQLQVIGKGHKAPKDLRKLIVAAIRGAGIGARKGRHNGPPVFDSNKLLNGRRAATAR